MSADFLAELWPPYALRITTSGPDGDLELRIPREDDLPELVALVRAGIHPDDFMPFDFPWTRVTGAQAAWNFVRHHAGVRARFSPQHFDLECVVLHAGVVVGVQALHVRNHTVTRTAETGSWLGRAHQGRGIATAMRQAICAFGFDTLGLRRITSSAFMDNTASLAVSRRVGYVENGVQWKDREGVEAANQRLLLTPETFRRGAPVTVAGAEALLDMLASDTT